MDVSSRQSAANPSIRYGSNVSPSKFSFFFPVCLRWISFLPKCIQTSSALHSPCPFHFHRLWCDWISTWAERDQHQRAHLWQSASRSVQTLTSTRTPAAPTYNQKVQSNLICYWNIFSDPKRVNAPLVFCCDGFFYFHTLEKKNRMRPSMTLSMWFEHTSPSLLQPLAHSERVSAQSWRVRWRMRQGWIEPVPAMEVGLLQTRR